MPEPKSTLEELLAALVDNRKCDDRHSMKREGCPECEADDMRRRTAAQRKLEALAPDMARAGQALATRLRRLLPFSPDGDTCWHCSLGSVPDEYLMHFDGDNIWGADQRCLMHEDYGDSLEALTGWEKLGKAKEGPQ